MKHISCPIHYSCFRDTCTKVSEPELVHCVLHFLTCYNHPKDNTFNWFWCVSLQHISRNV